MAFVGIRPAAQAEISESMRRLFIRLAIETEVREASIWSIMGDDQCVIKGAGSFHREGKYILKSVAKRWVKGHLYASSQSHRESGDCEVYVARTAEAIVFSTSHAAIKKLMPEAQVEVVGVRSV